MKKISQREARRLQQQVRDFEKRDAARRNAFIQDYPGGVHIGSLRNVQTNIDARIHVARLLGHAVVVTVDKSDLHFYALPEA